MVDGRTWVGRVQALYILGRVLAQLTENLVIGSAVLASWSGPGSPTEPVHDRTYLRMCIIHNGEQC